MSYRHEWIKCERCKAEHLMVLLEDGTHRVFGNISEVEEDEDDPFSDRAWQFEFWANESELYLLCPEESVLRAVAVNIMAGALDRGALNDTNVPAARQH